jgi:hypothetical protein
VFQPKGADVILEWIAVGLGVLAMAIMLALHFGRVRSAAGRSSFPPCGERWPEGPDEGLAPSGAGFDRLRENSPD